MIKWPEQRLTSHLHLVPRLRVELHLHYPIRFHGAVSDYNHHHSHLSFCRLNTIFLYVPFKPRSLLILSYYLRLGISSCFYCLEFSTVWCTFLFPPCLLLPFSSLLPCYEPCATVLICSSRGHVYPLFLLQCDGVESVVMETRGLLLP